MRNERWHWQPIGELFAIGAGKTMSIHARSGRNPIPFLRTSNVLWDEIDLSTVDQMSMTPEEQETKSLAPGDILVCEGGDIGRSAVWLGGVEQISFQNHLHRLRALDQRVVPRFIVFFLQSAFTQLGMFEGAGNQTTIPNLSRNRLAALEVPIPPFDEQFEIVRVLGQVREGLKLESALFHKAEQLKQAAMRELFTHGLHGEAQQDTEVGLIPESWKRDELGKIAEITYGAQAAVANATDPSIGTLILTNVNIHSDGAIDLDKKRYFKVPESQRERLMLRKGDVLFNWRSGSAAHVGKTAYFDLEGEVTYSSFILRLRPYKSVSAKFLFRFLSHIRSQGYFVAQKNVSSINSVFNASLTATIPIWFPDPTKQDAIVEIIDAVDQKIDLHKKKRVVLEDLFKSLLHKLMTGEIRVSDLDLSVLETTTAEASA